MNKFSAAMLGGCLLFACQSVLADPIAGEVCGGIAGKQCSAPNAYCDIGLGNCKTADASGTCKTKPENCTDQYVPVCGCNGKTYGNACGAAAAGMSIDHKGKCEKRSQ